MSPGRFSDDVLRKYPLDFDRIMILNSQFRQDKHWILSNDGLMCNSAGHPLTYEVGGTTGDEVLFDALKFSVCIVL